MKNNETFKTSLFVAFAGLFVGIAAMAYMVSKPTPLAGVEKEGEAFYPKFKNPSEALSLEVVALNAAKTDVNTFTVKQEDGIWVIPPFNYPADAKDRFFVTATSMIGAKRGAFVDRFPSNHKLYQVADPLKVDGSNPDAPSINDVGNRITLTGVGDKVLFDLIIGKEHSKQPGLYYVRKPGENAVWLSKVSIDLSTKFSDWINSDLLGVTSTDVRSISIKRYSIDERKATIKPEGESLLTRKSTAPAWQLKGLNIKTEQVNNPHIQELLTHLTGIKIVGVHKKPESLAGLVDSPNIAHAQGNLDISKVKLSDIQDSRLISKGFFLGQDTGEQLILLSNEGEVVITTEAGIAYALYFGELFTGSEYDIKLGFTKKKTEKPAKDKTENQLDTSLTKSRYLFVTARFDLDALGNPPLKPTKPKEPEKKKADGKQPVIAKKPDEVKKPKVKEDPYKILLDKYNSDLIKYGKDRKEYEQKILDGLKKAKEQNKRFGKWYYIISAESFEHLRLARKELVQPKGTKTEKKGNPTIPGLPPVLSFLRSNYSTNRLKGVR